MSESGVWRQDNLIPVDRLARMDDACLRVAAILDPGTLLQAVADEARAITDARYSAVGIIAERGNQPSLVVSGFVPAESALQDILSGRLDLREHLAGLTATKADETAEAPEGDPRSETIIEVPVLRQGDAIGRICVAGKADGRAFSTEDERVLRLFAAHAAVAITNALVFGAERQTRDNLERVIDISPVGVVIFDAQSGSLVSANDEARRLTSAFMGDGGGLEDFLLEATFSRGNDRELALDLPSVAQLLTSGETIQAEEFTAHLPDGRAASVLVNAVPIFSEDGEILFVLAAYQSVNPTEDLERQRAAFLAMVSEGLRTPLTAIKGSAAIALESTSRLDPVESRQFFRIIDSQADRMNSLINDLLDAARIDAGKLPITIEPVRVADLTEEARALFLADNVGSRVNIDLPPELPRIRADRRRLVQVLRILFSGASDYTAEGASINVSASREGTQVAINVLDQRTTIPAERLPQLFREFFRFGETSEQSDLEETELRLSICKGIVEAHGGRIWADNAGLDHGTRFTLTIPAADDAGAEGPAEITADASTSQARILVMDNDQDALGYVRRTLLAAGYNPILTETIEEMGRITETEMPNLILLDFAMLEAAGTESVQDIFRNAKAPVILMSWRGWNQEAAQAFEMGILDFIAKPFSQIELVTRVRAALRRRAQNEPDSLEPYASDNLRIEYAEHNVTVSGQEVQLTATEYNLLVELSTNAGRVMTHQRLLDRVWGLDQNRDPRILRAFVKSLRRKLGDDANDPRYIFTVPRVGYRMAKP